MKVKRTLCLLLTGLALLFAGCGNGKKSPSGTTPGNDVTLEPPQDPLPYNAVCYGRANRWMTEDFLATHGAFDDTKLEDLTAAITTQEEFDDYFQEFPADMDFENEMLVVFVFKNNTYENEVGIQRIELDGKKLKITYWMANKTNGQTSSSQTTTLRCVATKMDRMDFDDVEVNWVFRNVSGK